MEKLEALQLEKKLRDKFYEVTLSQKTDGPHTIIVFLDSKYREAVNFSRYCTIQHIGEVTPKAPFETYLGLNGDTCLLYFIENKGIEDTQIFIQHNP